MLGPSQWKFVGVATEGQVFSIAGFDVWKNPWVDTKERAQVKDPRYQQDFTFHVYTISCVSETLRFAAGEFSNGIFGFYLPRIIINPNVCSGKPVIYGTRISVQSILGFLAAGDSIEDLLKEYPSLIREDIQACLDYAS